MVFWRFITTNRVLAKFNIRPCCKHHVEECEVEIYAGGFPSHNLITSRETSQKTLARLEPVAQIHRAGR